MVIISQEIKLTEKIRKKIKLGTYQVFSIWREPAQLICLLKKFREVHR